MTATATPTLAQRFARSVGPGLAIAAVVTYALLIVAGQAAGRLTGRNLAFVVALPVALAIGLLAPRWALIGLLAIPPGYLLGSGPLSIGLLTLIVWLLAGLQVVRSGRFPGRIFIYLAPFMAIVVLMLVHDTVVSSAALAAATTLRSLLVYVVSVGVFAFMLVRDREIDPPTIADALIIGVVGTGLLFLIQTGFAPWSYVGGAFGGELQPGLLGYRTHFGYLMCMGFCVTVARLARTEYAARPVWGVPVLVFLGLMTFFSLTRGAWLAALIYVLLLPMRTGRYGVWILAALVVGVAVSLPFVQDRLVADATGGVFEAVRSGDFATGRWDLWQELWVRITDRLPWGGGFGYAFSLGPQELLGVTAFTAGRNPFVYPHNDFLYMLLDFGVAGFALLAAGWVVAIAAYRRVRDRGGWILGGVLLTMAIATVVDNGIFIRPLLERFLIVLAVCLGLSAALSQARSGAARSE